MSSHSTEHWLQGRVAAWEAIENELPAFEDTKPITYQQLRKIIHLYPEMARDIALARREAPNSRTTAYLDSIYQRLHRAMFRAPRAKASDLTAILRDEIPEIVFGLRWQIFSVALGFILSVVAGWWLVSQFPELAALFASESMIEGVQRGELWTDGLLNILPSSILSLQILTNNILVSLTAVSLGVLYGLGTIYIIGLNGLMLGGIFALTAQYGLAGNLFDFVVAHGCVELSVIVIAGAVGFSVGEALARPGARTRGEAFSFAMRRGTKLIGLCVVFLIGAGVIEGYISPNETFDRSVRVAVGAAYWLLFLFALCGWRLPRLSPLGTSLDTTHDAAP